MGNLDAWATRAASYRRPHPARLRGTDGGPASVPVGVVAARDVHDPAEQQGDEHDPDETPDERPVHGRNTTRPRAKPPARWPRGTPTRPEDGGPGGTRTAADWAGADRPDGWAGRSRMDRNRKRRTAGADGRSSPHSSPSSTLCAGSSRPVPPSTKLDLVHAHESRLLPPGATTISGNRKNFTSGEIPANSGNFRRREQTSRNFRTFRESPVAGIARALEAGREAGA